MATSGAMSTTNQYVKYTITVTQNSQSVANNTSNVTVSVRFYRTNTGYTTYGTGTLYCKINGTTYSASVTPDDKITNSGIVLFTKTLDISHNSDGTKTLTCSAWIDHNVITSNEQSYSQVMTTIPRKSTLTASNGTLGTAQTLTVDRKSSSFTHTITYECGEESGIVCVKSGSTSISFTPPIDLAAQNTTGTSVSVVFTIMTFNGNDTVGTSTKTITCAIPSSVKPTVSIAVSDGAGYSGTYGGYIQGKSTFKITLTESGSYGSTIKSRKTTADGKTYTVASFTTAVISGSGTLTISATVTDSRGRTGTASKTVTVLAYKTPIVSSTKVYRCDSTGTASGGGAYLAVKFNATITSLNSKNTATYTVKYKKTSETAYTTVTLSDYANNYSVSNGICVFTAATASSYDVILNVADSFGTVGRTMVGASVRKLFSWGTKIFGIAFGKTVELEDTMEVDIYGKFNKDVYGLAGGMGYMPSIPSDSDLNDYIVPGWYAINGNATAATITNMPVQTAGRLQVASALGQHASSVVSSTYGYIVQFFYNYQGKTFVRHISTNGTAGAWSYSAWSRILQDDGSSLAIDAATTFNAASTATKDFTVKGALYLDGKVQMQNAQSIYLVNADQTAAYNALHMNSSAAIALGYGSYSNSSGMTVIYGNEVRTISKKGHRFPLDSYGISFDEKARIYSPSNQKLYIRASNEINYSLYLGVIESNWAFCPYKDTYLRLGSPSYRWGIIYSSSATVSTSDRNLKKNIEDLTDKHLEFFMMLQPKSFKFKDGTSGRTHIGFISQDVEDAMKACGFSSLDFAGFCKDQKTEIVKKTVEVEKEVAKDVKTETGEIVCELVKEVVEETIEETVPIEGEYIYSLRYEEFIALNTFMLQRQQNEIKTLKAELETLKADIEMIKAAVLK